MASDQRLVLISYSRVDSEFAYRLRADLEASGFTTWIDTAKLNDQGGQEWLRLIQDAVDACQAMVVIVSPDSINSRYVHMEYHRAQKLGKLVIPIHYRTVTSAPIDLDLDQWIDFRSGQGVNEPYQVGLTSLIRSLMRVPAPPKYPDLPQAPQAAPLTISEGADIPEFRRMSPPPPPPQELTTLMTAAFDARGKGDLASEQYFIQQILAQDSSFLDGRFVQRYEEVTRQIEAQRIERLRAIARGAVAEKQWRRALGAWQALLEVRSSDGEAQAGARTARIERANEALRDGELDEAVGTWQALLRNAPTDQMAQNGLRAALLARADDAWRQADWTRAAESWETLRSHFPADEDAQSYLDAIAQNQRGDLYYQSAQRSLAVGNVEGARVALEDLYRVAPNYGDPQGIALKADVNVPVLSFSRQQSASTPQVEAPAVLSVPLKVPTSTPTTPRHPVDPPTGLHRLPTVWRNIIIGALSLSIVIACCIGFVLPSFSSASASAQATETALAQQPTSSPVSTISPAARKIWAYQTGAQIGVAAAVGGGVVYTISHDGFLYALDQRSGALLWHLWVGESGDPWSDPQLVNGMLYFGTFNGHVEAVSVSNRSVAWSAALGAAVGAAPTISGQALYVGSEDHNVYALDLATGRQLFKTATGGAVDSSVVVKDGMLYVGSSDGYLYALRMSDLSVVWKKVSGSGAFDSTPLLYNGALYYAAGHSLTAWNPATGAQLWQSSLSGIAYRLPATDGSRLYVGTDDGYITVFNLDGSLVWHTSVPASDGATPNIRSTIAVYLGGLYFGSWNHHVYRLSAATGAVDWSFTTGDLVEGEVTIVGGVLYVGSHDGKLYALRT